MSDEDFKRSTRVHRPTFAKRLEVVEQGLRNFGRPPKLRQSDQLLMALLVASMNRPCAGRLKIKKTENTLIESEQFHLPGVKDFTPAGWSLRSSLLMQQSSRLNVLKKNSGSAIAAKRDVMRRKIK